jgi:hypothetical protein
VVAAVAASAAFGCLSTAASAQSPDTGGSYDDVALLEAGVAFQASLETPEDADVFRADVPSGNTALRIEVTSRTPGCEVWGAMTGAAFATTNRSFAPFRAPVGFIQTSIGAGSFYAVVDAGPYGPGPGCLERKFLITAHVVRVDLGDEALALADAAVESASASAVCKCWAYSNEVGTLATKITVTKHNLRDAQGERREKLRRRLNRLRKRSRHFRPLMNHWCRKAGLA